MASQNQCSIAVAKYLRKFNLKRRKIFVGGGRLRVLVISVNGLGPTALELLIRKNIVVQVEVEKYSIVAMKQTGRGGQTAVSLCPF